MTPDELRALKEKHQEQARKIKEIEEAWEDKRLKHAPDSMHDYTILIKTHPLHFTSVEKICNTIVQKYGDMFVDVAVEVEVLTYDREDKRT